MFLNSNKKAAILIVIAVFLIVADRALKILALNIFRTDPLILTDWLKLSLVINRNIAFSLPVYGILLTLVLIVLIVGLIWYFVKMFKKQQTVQASLLFFVILGASSNLADRFLYAGVIDYINVEKFTIFNLADAMILIGIILFIRTGVKKFARQPLT